jgi:toxin ParE1/3/4
MTPVWTPKALADLASLRDYIAEHDQSAAKRVAMRIIYCVETLLPQSPETGRPGRLSGTRELVITGTPFIVPYRLRGRTIQILRVYHGARRWPDRFRTAQQ